MASYEPVRAIQRGLAVLRAVSEHGPITIVDLVERCGFPQPTMVRILETLIAEGYIYRVAGEPKYRVTRTCALVKPRVRPEVAPSGNRLPYRRPHAHPDRLAVQSRRF